MQASKETVSVVIPVFNGAATIAAAIDSVLAQAFTGAVEIVVVDDGSTDATAAAIEPYRGRATILEQPNRGPAAARNAGARATHGEYLAFLDADDVWTAHKLDAELAALKRAADAVLVYSNAEKIDASGRRLGATYTPAGQCRAPAMDDMLSTLWSILPSTVVIRRAAFDAVGGFCEDFATAHPQWEDSYFMVLARERGPFVYLDQPTVLYRVPASVAENFRRRGVWAQPGAGATRVERYVGNSDLMQRLVHERFGARGARLVAAIRAATANLLVSAGLTAMVEGDRRFARRAYLLAMRYDALNAKNVARLTWTWLPSSVARAVSALLPRRIQRAMSGPAHA